MGLLYASQSTVGGKKYCFYRRINRNANNAGISFSVNEYLITQPKVAALHHFPFSSFPILCYIKSYSLFNFDQVCGKLDGILRTSLDILIIKCCVHKNKILKKNDFSCFKTLMYLSC